MTHDSWLMTDLWLKTQDLWLLMKLTLRRFIIDCELWFLMTHDSWLSWLDFYFRLIWPYELMKTNNPLWDSILLIINYDLILMVQNEMMDMTDSYGSYDSYDSWKTQTWLDSTWLVHANVLILMYINLYLCNWIQWFWVATPCIKLSVSVRICKYVYCNGGFNVLYDTIQDYTTAIHKNPSLHHEFLDARRKWISMKIEDPTLKLRGSSDLVPPRLVDIEQIQD